MPVSKVRSRVCQQCGKNYVLGVDSSQHKYCSVECRRKWHTLKWTAHKRDPRKRKDYWLRSKYGIGIDEYEDLLQKQGNACAICLTTRPRGYNWHVDHNHKTGKVRGILCCKCNQALGLVDEKLVVLKSMMQYLGDHDD